MKKIIAGSGAIAMAFFVVYFWAGFTDHPPKESQDFAAWVQAFGSIGAILAAIWVSYHQHEQTLEAARQDRLHKQLVTIQVFVVATRETKRFLALAERDMKTANKAEATGIVAAAKSWGSQMSETVAAIQLGDLPFADLVQDIGFLRQTVHRIGTSLEHAGITKHIFETGPDAFSMMQLSLDNTEYNLIAAETALKSGKPFVRRRIGDAKTGSA